MKVRIVKEHINYSIGEHEVSEERGNYLVAMGIAEKVETGHESKKEIVPITEKVQVKQPRKKQVRRKKEKNEL